jgi:GTP-binding protein
MRADWGVMAEDYLSQRDQVVVCSQRSDSRREPTGLDLQLNEWLNFNGKPHIAVATKSDKLSRNQLPKQLKAIRLALKFSEVIAYSAETGKGRDDVWKSVQTAIASWP